MIVTFRWRNASVQRKVLEKAREKSLYTFDLQTGISFLNNVNKVIERIECHPEQFPVHQDASGRKAHIATITDKGAGVGGVIPYFLEKEKKEAIGLGVFSSKPKYFL